MFLEQVRATIRRHSLLAAGETVVVGVSGGPDSLCLLHVLSCLRSEVDLALHVAHLDHGLRGAESEADAGYVASVAEGWGLPCTVERVDVPALAREGRLAVEEAARRARYAFLARVAGAVGSRTIAVGHNADDQAETVLMHWLRGSGLAGLRGMQPRTRLGDYRLLEGPAGPLPVPSDLWLVRPLLEVTRADILAYCSSQGLEPRFDRSNLDTTYFRNWLRLTVIPLLAQHNPRIQDVIRRSARVFTDDYALLRLLLDDAWPAIVQEEAPGRIAFDLAVWRALPTSLQRSTLREAIHRLRRSLRDIAFVHIEDALEVARDGPAGQQATLPQGLVLTVGYDRLMVAGVDSSEALPDWPLLAAEGEPLRVSVPGCTPLPESEWELEAELVDRSGLPSDWDANPDPWLAYLDGSAVAGPLWLRTRRQGDRFRPMGMRGHVALSNFLTNQKAPRRARCRLPLLVDENGILWVCGQRPDERARVREGTGQVLVLRFARWVRQAAAPSGSGGG